MDFAPSEAAPDSRGLSIIGMKVSLKWLNCLIVTCCTTFGSATQVRLKCFWSDQKNLKCICETEGSQVKLHTALPEPSDLTVQLDKIVMHCVLSVRYHTWYQQ